MTSTWTNLNQAMREDGYVSYDRYLAREVGSYYTWQCEYCDGELDDEGWCRSDCETHDDEEDEDE